ncbi:MAG: hypothetical protein KGL39_06670 [Patescibacteria group bacterium]|nr:hypothetical protein [Patescibacteria group bacterium]
MAGEKINFNLTIQAFDYQGTLYTPAVLTQQFLSQTKLAFNEFTIAAASTQDVWDPATWTGFPFSALQAAAFSACDIGATPSTSVVPVEIELLPDFVASTTPTKSGIILTIPAGGWLVIPSFASYAEPTNAYDQLTGSSAHVINRIRARNKNASVGAKLAMWAVDSTAP